MMIFYKYYFIFGMKFNVVIFKQYLLFWMWFIFRVDGDFNNVEYGDLVFFCFLFEIDRNECGLQR